MRRSGVQAERTTMRHSSWASDTSMAFTGPRRVRTPIGGLDSARRPRSQKLRLLAKRATYLNRIRPPRVELSLRPVSASAEVPEITATCCQTAVKNEKRPPRKATVIVHSHSSCPSSDRTRTLLIQSQGANSAISSNVLRDRVVAQRHAFAFTFDNASQVL